MVQGISREKTKENKLECEALFKSVCEFESYIKDISIKMKRLLVEKKNYDKALNESFSINMRTSKTKMNLRKKKKMQGERKDV